AVVFAGGAGGRLVVGRGGRAGAALAAVPGAAPYRMARLTGFMDPWADPFNTGFQLTQSLIAIGTGEWFGLGLGASVQKMFYLPEAHTDFVFAVLAEEFGLAGSLVVILLYGLVIWRGMLIARSAAERERVFQASLAFGIAVWLAAQVFVNIGVNMGLLPTKGLTLPLLSYGRSSLLVTLAALALLLRVDLENRGLVNSEARRRRTRGRSA
ncbi:MAG: FtsW/RodA/SpoVE family cell cycle protein, partial [Chromatiales bacterium]|nr:FtsW/RodA/SpoVE family cell cycle protein [Chromatiales bacterium]